MQYSSFAGILANYIKPTEIYTASYLAIKKYTCLQQMDKCQKINPPGQIHNYNTS